MKLNHLKKATDYFNQIQKLDLEIINIEKLAIKIADTEQKISLSLSGLSTDKKQNILDEYGSLKNPDKTIRNVFDLYMPSFIQNKTEPKEEFLFNIDEVDALNVLGCLLVRKQEKRKELILKLKEITT